MPLPPYSGGFPHAVAVLILLLVNGAGAGINEAGLFLEARADALKGVAGGVQALFIPWKVRTKQRMHSLVKSFVGCEASLQPFPVEVML